MMFNMLVMKQFEREWKQALKMYFYAGFGTYFPSLNSQWILINIYHLLVSKDTKSLFAWRSDITSNE